jgi:putative phage-type endonuclease
MFTKKPIRIDVQQRTPEWLTWKEGKVGGSQAAAITGKSPFKTRLQEWEDWISGKKTTVNAAMKRGIDYEDEALEWFNRKMGNGKFAPACFQAGFNENIIASLDGWDGEVSVEIKIPGKFNVEIPEMYGIQVQHQTMVMTTPHSWYCEYNPDLKMGWYTLIQRDQPLIEEIYVEECRFLDSIINLDPPEATDRDWVEESDPELSVRVIKYRANSMLLADLEKRQKTLREEIVASAKHVRTRCRGISVQKVIRKGNIDWQRLAADHGITDQEKYRGKNIESWRIYE